jgi:hypothetical protein
MLPVSFRRLQPDAFVMALVATVVIATRGIGHLAHR